MKKLILMMTVGLITTCGILEAKPVLHVTYDVTIGRPRKGCEKVWLCIKVANVDVDLDGGMITKGHGIVIEDDGSLFIAINEDMVRNESMEKYNTLSSGSIYLDSEETLPQNALTALGYKGRNVFPAGKYYVTKSEGYFLIKLK